MANNLTENIIGVDTKMLRVMIAAPGDLKDEIQIVRDEIYSWNSDHSEAEKIVLLPKHWQTNSHPRLGKSGQDFINEQIVDTADILIAIFWKRLGTPTKTAPSGTVEEISQFYASGRSVKVYFSNSPVDRRMLNSKSEIEEADRLEKFRNSVQKLGLYTPYDDLNAFRAEIRKHLYAEIRSLREEGFKHKRRLSRIERYLDINDFSGIDRDNWEEKAVGITTFIIQKTITDNDYRINFTMADVVKVFQLVLWHVGVKFYRVNRSSAIAKLISECLSLGLVDAKNKKLSSGSRTAYLYSTISKASLTKVFNGVISRDGDIYYGFSVEDEITNQYLKAKRDVAKVGVDMQVFDQIIELVEDKKELEIKIPKDIVSKIEDINSLEHRRQRRAFTDVKKEDK